MNLIFGGNDFDEYTLVSLFTMFAFVHISKDDERVWDMEGLINIH